MKKQLLGLATLICALTASTQITAQQLQADNIDEIIQSMTLDEKVHLLVGTGMPGVAIGMPVIGATRSLVPGAAGTTYPIPRLGIPAIVLSDGPAGLRIDPKRDFYSKTYYCTWFPIGTCLSSSWNTNLVQMVGKAIGEEVRDYGADVLLAPANNIHRNPLCGRNFEYYSEDPLLSGNIAAAYILGIQSNGVGTSLKHFAFNNQETNRMGNDARVSQRAAREIYLKGFEIAVKKAQPWTVMSSYNKINGTYTAECYDLLTTILRDEWGFKGAVMTDWFGGKNRSAGVMAGNDMIQPGLPFDPDSIKAGLTDGRITMEALNRNVRHVLDLIVKTPRFKKQSYSSDPDLKAHAKVTREAATEGITLLKNDNATLPFGKRIKNVAVYGSTSYDILAGGSGSGSVNTSYTVSLIEGLRNNGYTSDTAILESYRKFINDFKREQSKKQTSWFSTPAHADEFVPVADSLTLQAQRCDAAIITIGRNAGEGSDRKAELFYLNDNERKLITDITAAFHKEGKQVVVLLNIDGVIETASWKDIPDAILLPWQCGQEGGNSMADVISGNRYPSGKLPMTFPIELDDHYSSKNFVKDAPSVRPTIGQKESGEQRNLIDYTNYEEGIYVGYRYFDSFKKNVSYPFGYGMSYTTFEYSEPSVKMNGNTIEVSVSVTNTGKAVGKEIAEVYVTAPKGKIDKPAQELKAFAKTRELKPGESETLSMTIHPIDLASFNENQSAWILDAGKYTFKVGASSRDIKGVTTVKLNGMKQKVHNVLKPVEKLNTLVCRP
ncbi:glycoside hydrolase family 3 C-terminal domain-containing protein [Phocaeicola oris]|uniref:glycoside hydrolase family 3 C-terminal domain-containing protein n=1 Tax=Phocaeicola oris TaxID=2896850 RepID=UPI00234E476F|nr:glycoside hydrolase family 3 C-terminal domain-containing protein [Phocaeicola oris]MCE2617578.1 glycoside hydrolase family 3 C-terminal domain-containing protein [Phocaeicola oris]